MIWNNVELFNVAQIEQRLDGTLQMYRFPKTVSDAIGGDKHLIHKSYARDNSGCEIRFVCDKCDVVLSACNVAGYVEIYRGDFFVRCERIDVGVKTRISLEKGQIMDQCDISGIASSYSPDVWRIVMFGMSCVICDIDNYTPIRPPKASEVPEATIISYGSSISHGTFALLFTNSYVYRASNSAGMQVLCKGMGGSCHCEKEVADYIADENWDVAILELAVNMLDWYDEDEFEKRVEYLLSNALKTGKKVMLISHFRHFRDLKTEISYVERNKNFIKITQKLAEKYKSDNLCYVDGREILDDYKLLSSDLIHPTPYGHFVMGERIGKKLVDFVR